MKQWAKISRHVGPEGTTITYGAEGCPYEIESRKRAIPHAGGYPGTWNHTDFVVIREGRELAEKQTLRAAKEYVERLEAEA